MGWVLVDEGALRLALNALRRDAEVGEEVRSEVANELERDCVPVPEPVAWWDATEPSGLRWARAGGITRSSFADGAPVVVLPSSSGDESVLRGLA